MTARTAALLLVAASSLPAQFGLLQPSGSLELGQGPVTQLVARGSKVYAVVSNARGSSLISIDSQLFVREGISLGKENVTGMDVDDAGQIYLVFDGKRMVVLSPKWATLKTATFDPPVSAFAVVDGTPMGLGRDGVLRSTDSATPRLSLDKYPPPWVFFAAGKDRVGILQTATGSVHTFEVAGKTSEHSELAGAFKSGFVSATGTPDGRVFVLGKPLAGAVSLMVCRPSPPRILDFDLPSGMNPRFVAATNQRVYLADPNGTIAFYDLPVETP